MYRLRSDLAYVDAGEALRRSVDDPLALQNFGYSYYFSDKWPKSMGLFRVQITELIRTSVFDIRKYEIQTLVKCTGVRGSVIRPEVTLSVLPQFLKVPCIAVQITKSTPFSTT